MSTRELEGLLTEAAKVISVRFLLPNIWYCPCCDRRERKTLYEYDALDKFVAFDHAPDCLIPRLAPFKLKPSTIEDGRL